MKSCICESRSKADGVGGGTKGAWEGEGEEGEGAEGILRSTRYLV